MIGRYVAPGHAGPRRNGRTARQTLHAIAMIGADARKAVAAPARDSHMARLAVAKTAHRLSGDDAADADPRADGDIGPARQPLRAAPQPFRNGRAPGVRVDRDRLSPGPLGTDGLVHPGPWPG